MSWKKHSSSISPTQGGAKLRLGTPVKTESKEANFLRVAYQERLDAAVKEVRLKEQRARLKAKADAGSGIGAKGIKPPIKVNLSEVAKRHGVNRTTLHDRIAKMKADKRVRKTRKPRTWSVSAKEDFSKLRDLLFETPPEKYSQGHLWTQPGIVKLMADKMGAHIDETTAGSYLAFLGLCRPVDDRRFKKAQWIAMREAASTEGRRAEKPRRFLFLDESRICGAADSSIKSKKEIGPGFRIRKRCLLAVIDSKGSFRLFRHPRRSKGASKPLDDKAFLALLKALKFMGRVCLIVDCSLPLPDGKAMRYIGKSMGRVQLVDIRNKPGPPTVKTPYGRAFSPEYVGSWPPDFVDPDLDVAKHDLDNPPEWDGPLRGFPHT